MWRKLTELIATIQKSDEAAKKRWLVGASALGMALVIILWLSYIDLTIKPASNASAADSDIGVIAVFRNGLGVVINKVQDQIKNLISEITSDRSIIIEK